MGSEVFTQNTGAAILARVIEADEKEVTPDVAPYLLSKQLRKLTGSESMNSQLRRARVQ